MNNERRNSNRALVQNWAHSYSFIADLAQQESEFEIADYFKKGYDKMMSKLSFKREKIVDIQKALQTADANQDNKLDYEEWRQELKL